MKEFLLTQAMDPQKWLLLALLAFQAYKFFYPDKAATFLAWAVPAAYGVVEGLEKSGAISKSSKLGLFLDNLLAKAAEQKINLTAKDIVTAKAMVEGMAANKPPLLTPGNPTATPVLK